MSSQAYSAVALKVKSNANIETVKEEILNNVFEIFKDKFKDEFNFVED